MDAMSQTGLNAFKAGLATSGGLGRGGATGGPPVQRQTPFAPPTTGGAAPPAVSLQLPEGASRAMFRPGATIHGQVAGQQNGQTFLQLGDQMLRAESRVPLRIGDSVSFQVQGEHKGQLHLKLVTTPFQKMSMGDLTQTLTSLRMPVNESNLNLAKALVELKIPLTADNMTQMKQVLAQTAASGPGGAASTGAGGNQAAPLPTQVAATSYLQNSQLPVTPQNVTVLSNFLANNPQVGMQMMALNTELRKLTESTHKVNHEITSMIAGVQQQVGKLTLEPKKRFDDGAMNLRNLKKMAKETGIETHMGPAGTGGGEEWDFPEMLKRMRERFSKDGLGSRELMSLIKGLEENLQAQKLINGARSESQLGYYYLQLPLQGEFDAAEVWLQYYEDGGGQRHVTPEDTKLEFLVTTEEVGELHFTVDLKKGVASVEVGTASEEVRRFAARYLPALAERLGELGWERGRMRSVFRPHSGKRELVERTDFAELERYDVQA